MTPEAARLKLRRLVRLRRDEAAYVRLTRLLAERPEIVSSALAQASQAAGRVRLAAEQLEAELVRELAHLSARPMPVPDSTDGSGPDPLATVPRIPPG